MKLSTILNKIGLYTKKQYDKIIKEKNEVTLACQAMDKINEELPFNFDKLLGMYNDERLNCLFYKMVTLCHNNSARHPLIIRWYERLRKALPKKINFKS